MNTSYPRLFSLLFALSFTACLLPSEDDDGPSDSDAPVITYATPVVDTLGASVSHPVLSTGGTVTSYALLSGLPAGYSLNASTGEISGTPTDTSAAMDYGIVATGPGGSDTAAINVRVVNPALTPVDTFTVGDTAGSFATLNARINVPTDTSTHAAMRTLIITISSSVQADAVVRDTFVLEQFLFDLLYPGDYQHQKTYDLKALRDWNFSAKALDAGGATVYADSASIDSLLVGEIRQLVITFE